MADDPEATADPGDLRWFSASWPDRSLDFPGLVPAPLVSRPMGLSTPAASPPRFSPLRC